MNQDTIDAARIAAAKYKVPLANLLACIEVESNGVISAMINQGGSTLPEPIIRWEGHYFDKRLSAAQRAIARKQGLASPTAGGIGNPSSQQSRWTKLLLPALKLNRKAAIESVSWGVGQVMGAHWDKLGFTSPDDLMLAARAGAAGQIDLMLRYCAKFGLIDELQRGDFAGFARGYNGPNYKKYAYDTKMLAGSKKWARTIPGATTIESTHKRAVDAASMARMGTEGSKVRQAQQLLRRAGHAIDVDGDFGPATKNAVKDFQAANGLEVDGIVGPETWQALEAFKVDPAEQPGVPGIAESVMATPEGRQGAAAVGSAVGLETAKGALSTATESLSAMTEVPVIKYVFTGLTVLSVMLTIGGIAWVAWGWWKANTNRGIVTGDVELPTVHEDV